MTRAILAGCLAGLTIAGLAYLATKPAAAYLLDSFDVDYCPEGDDQ